MFRAELQWQTQVVVVPSAVHSIISNMLHTKAPTACARQPQVSHLPCVRSRLRLNVQPARVGTQMHAARRHADSDDLLSSMLQKPLRMVSAVVLSALAFSSQPVQAQQDSWTGPARVVDGDTMYIGDQKFRLYGVDAPEKAQTCLNAVNAPYACGLISKDALAQKVGNQSVTCRTKAKDQYGRTVAVCSLNSIMGPEDLNKWLVDNGFAVAYREYGKDYIPAEEAAKAARKGVWAGSFQYPAQWRKEEKAGVPHPPLAPNTSYIPPPLPAGLAPPSQPALTQLVVDAVKAPSPAATTAVLPDICGKGVLPIKGNINTKGTKIYHMPGGPYYDQVLVEPEKGESYFCSEADAEKAGYRPVATRGAAGK